MNRKLSTLFHNYQPPVNPPEMRRSRAERIVHNGYVYSLERTNKTTSKSYWQCREGGGGKKCGGRLHTDAFDHTRVISVIHNHCHMPTAPDQRNGILPGIGAVPKPSLARMRSNEAPMMAKVKRLVSQSGQRPQQRLQRTALAKHPHPTIVTAPPFTTAAMTRSSTFARPSAQTSAARTPQRSEISEFQDFSIQDDDISLGEEKPDVRTLASNRPKPSILLNGPRITDQRASDNARPDGQENASNSSSIVSGSDQQQLLPANNKARDITHINQSVRSVIAAYVSDDFIERKAHFFSSKQPAMKVTTRDGDVVEVMGTFLCSRCDLPKKRCYEMQSR